MEERDESISEVDTIGKRQMRTRANSVSQLPIIEEEPKFKGKKPARARSALETYTTSRRLTRKQASMVKDISSSDVKAEDISEVEEDDVFDPIKLLDKEPFKGEYNIYYITCF